MNDIFPIIICIILGFLISTAVGYSLAEDNNHASIQLGKGFANQTCIDKNTTFIKIDSINGVPNIVCSGVTAKVDGINYAITFRG